MKIIMLVDMHRKRKNEEKIVDYRFSSLMPAVQRMLFALVPVIMLAFSLGSAKSAPLPGECGPQEWGFRQVMITDSEMGRTFIASIYYPGQEQGIEVPLDPSYGPYPGVAFGHGFLMNRKRYDFYGQHLATHGYVVVLLNFTDLDNARQCSELSACLTWMEEKNVDPESWLFGGIDIERFAVAGHSMGGGVSVQVAGEDSRVDVCAPLAPGTNSSDSTVRS